MSDKTITALYDDYDDAAEAVRRLEEAGIPRGDISIVGNNADDRLSGRANRSYGTDTDRMDDGATGAGTGATVGTVVGGGLGLLTGLGLMAIPGVGPVVAAGWIVTTLVGAGVGAAVGGLAGALVDAGVSEEDARAYEEGVRRGGTLVTVRTSDANVDRVVDILDDHGTVDIDERQASWRSEGWTGTGSRAGTDTIAGTDSIAGIGSGAASTVGVTGMPTGMGAAAAGALGMESAADRPMRDRAVGDEEVGASTPIAASMPTDRSADMRTTDLAGRDMAREDRARGDMEREEVIPVVEEDLRVGKREVNRGRVRIHSHVVETPVQEQVTLREERVDVERRPVDAPLRAADVSGDDLFRERTVEFEERAEEAVVDKEARVKEELVVHKDVEQHTETVADKVRRTEVEVEDERGQRITGTNDRDRT